ncbi:MAG: glutamate synthase, partial [Candidatus Korarchaeota archaeon NZ13-K]
MKFAFLCKERRSSSGFRIAVVGSGAAGLSAAGYLVCRGHEVEFYEKLPLPGGLMTFAIPKSRIPLDSVMEGVEDLERNFSVRFNLGVRVCCGGGDEGDHLSRDRVSLSELSRDYDAVLIATGTWRSRRLNVEGEDSKNVFSAIDYLMRLHS